jgi:hypothetical protein
MAGVCRGCGVQERGALGGGSVCQRAAAARRASCGAQQSTSMQRGSSRALEIRSSFSAIQNRLPGYNSIHFGPESASSRSLVDGAKSGSPDPSHLHHSPSSARSRRGTRDARIRRTSSDGQLQQPSVRGPTLQPRCLAPPSRASAMPPSPLHRWRRCRCRQLPRPQRLLPRSVAPSARAGSASLSRALLRSRWSK